MIYENISAKGLSAAVVRKCLIRTSVQTAPFYIFTFTGNCNAIFL